MFTEIELTYLASQRLGRLATAQPNGTLQVNPVGFTYNHATSTIDVVDFLRHRRARHRSAKAEGQQPNVH